MHIPTLIIIYRTDPRAKECTQTFGTVRTSVEHVSRGDLRVRVVLGNAGGRGHVLRYLQGVT